MVQQAVPIAYAAARQTAALADLSGYGWLKISGRDRLDFLQRLSTNDFRQLAPGRGLPTVLTSAMGRVIAFLVVYAGNDALLVRTSPGQALSVNRYLDSMIFFQDAVQVSGTNDSLRTMGLFGPHSERVLADRAAIANASGLPDEPYAWTEAEIDGVTVTLYRGGSLDLPDWWIVADAGRGDEIWSALAHDLPVLDPASLETLRVEAGIPAWGHELGDQVTPLESGLAAAISDSKGCYTGQEVIARQVNYDKVTRRLVGLLLPEATGEEIAGAAVVAGGGRPGFVGSAVRSPAFGRSLALAVVPRDAARPGSTVTIKTGEREVEAVVAELPFVKDH